MTMHTVREMHTAREMMPNDAICIDERTADISAATTSS